MPYTVWLDQHLVGETDFEHPGAVPAQRLGALRPTAHGTTVLPGICGFLSAASAFQSALQRRGLCQADGDVPADADSEAIVHELESTAEGREMVEVVKRLDRLELRGPGGELLMKKSVAVTDLQELVALGGMRDVDAAAVPADHPRFLISVTLANGAWDGGRDQRRTMPRFRMRWRR